MVSAPVVDSGKLKLHGEPAPHGWKALHAVREYNSDLFG
jgi:hypothetical protein